MDSDSFGCNEENYYAVLGCNESATVHELKRCYQDLIKQYHPDKQSGLEEISSDRFILINKAFNTLKDEQLRKEYDASRLAGDLDNNPLIFAELSKKHLTFVEGYSRFLCRCGNYIEIPEDTLVEVIIECSECSNCILIK